MGLSFDLKVEELPDQILDLAFASHAWFSPSGFVVGFGENALQPDGTVTLGEDSTPGWNEGYLDIISTARWAGMQPVPGSWVINDIKTANGTVFLCGSYTAQWKGPEWQTDGLDNIPDLWFDVNSIDTSFMLEGFTDGFFACCKYDQLENPKAWHILPTRSLMEMPEVELPPNALKPTLVDPATGYVAENNNGGLYDMVIDIRTENKDVKRGWTAEVAETFGGQPQPVVITCVGYMPCEGYGTTVHNSLYQTESYKWSIYSNQDFVPVVYSFVINIFDDKYNGKDLYMNYTDNTMINPYYTNSKLSFPNSGFGGDETEDAHYYWNYNWLIGGEDRGINPNASGGYSGIDWSGTSIATNGSFTGLGNTKNLQTMQLPDTSLNRPYCSAAGRYGSLQVYPFEQISYRAHQIGVRADINNIFRPLGSFVGGWQSYNNQTPRQPSIYPFTPTPLIGTFPVRKPVEQAFSSPNYAAFKTTVYANQRANSAFNEFCPQPNYFNPTFTAAVAPYRPMAQTDAEIWRHGFIPRRLTGIERSYNSFAYTTVKGGLYYPTYEYASLYGDTEFVGQTYFTSAISYLVMTGDCLEDHKPSPNRQLTCKVDGGIPVYSPLCVVGNMGQSIAGSDGITPATQYYQKGLPYFDDNKEPTGENYGCNTWFKCLTRRNISVEDVNAENYFGTAPENTSLDFATFLKPLPVVHADSPAINNQIFNINLLLQSNETVDGTNERRAEIYTLQSWALNDQISGLPFDMNAIVPFMTHQGRAEAAIDTITPTPTKNWSWLPNEWTYHQTQGTPLTIDDVKAQRNCFHRYLQPKTYQYSQRVGLGQMVLGYWDGRNTPDGGPETGPQVMVFDPGYQAINIQPNEDTWVLNTLEPTWGGIYRFGIPIVAAPPTGGTNNSPGIYDYWDERQDALPQVENQIPNQLYSIPTTDQTKTGPITPLPNAWQSGNMTWKLTINFADLNAFYGGATAPAPTYTYTTIDSLATELNLGLAYVKSAGVPYSLTFGTGGGRSLLGLAGLTFYTTSDKQGIYLRVDVPGQSASNNVSMGRLIIGHSAAPWIGAPAAVANEYYPWNSAGPVREQQWGYDAIQGPVSTFSFAGFRQGGVAVVEQPTIDSLRFDLKSYGDTFDENCPGGVSSTRRPACCDYDLDRAQWMVTFADNDKAVSEKGNGFAAISTTADFAEFLDQTQNFTDVPDFFKLATVWNVANTAVYANSLWAARQGSSNFDGIVWVGAGNPLATRTYPPANNDGITSSTYVWATWWCDILPTVGFQPDNPEYSYAGPECLGAGLDPATAWENTLFVPVSPDWIGTGVTSYCYHGNQPYRIQGTTGRTVQVWLNYILYDGVDSVIAVELQNLGLRVTPENVEWYKRKIMGQESAEMTLEEVEKWMGLQREQYQDILKQRNRNYRMRQRREEGGSHKPSATEALGEQLAGDFYALDEESIEELLPQLRILPPNPDTDVMMDVDAFGNVASGDIQKTEEKRRDSEN